MNNFLKRLKQAVSCEHDYTRMHNEYKLVYDSLKNAKPKQLESAENYANNWIISTGYREGLHFLGNFPWRTLAAISGKRRYHQNFLESLNFWINELQAMIDEKEQSHNNSKKMGFLAKHD